MLNNSHYNRFRLIRCCRIQIWKPFFMKFNFYHLILQNMIFDPIHFTLILVKMVPSKLLISGNIKKCRLIFSITSFFKAQSNILTRSTISKVSRLSEINLQNVAIFGSGPFSTEPCRAREARKFLENFFTLNCVQGMAWVSTVSILAIEKVRN